MYTYGKEMGMFRYGDTEISRKTDWNLSRPSYRNLMFRILFCHTTGMMIHNAFQTFVCFFRVEPPHSLLQIRTCPQNMSGNYE